MSAINEVLLMRTSALYVEINTLLKAKKISRTVYNEFVDYINKLGFTTIKLLEYAELCHE